MPPEVTWMCTVARKYK